MELQRSGLYVLVLLLLSILNGAQAHANLPRVFEVQVGPRHS